MENTSVNTKPTIKQKTAHWPVAAIVLSGLAFAVYAYFVARNLIPAIRVMRQMRTVNQPSYLKPYYPLLISLLMYLVCFLLFLITRRKLRWLTILPLVFYILNNIRFDERAMLYFARTANTIVDALQRGTLHAVLVVLPLILFVLMTIMMLILLIARKKPLAIITSILAGLTLLSELSVYLYYYIRGIAIHSLLMNVLNFYIPWVITVVLFYAVYIIIPFATLKPYGKKGQAVAAPVAPAPVAEPVAEPVVAQAPAPEAAPEAAPTPAAPSYMFCTQCGAKILSDAKFCDMCGAPVGVPLPNDPS
jgi:hypothetical protein